MKCAHCALTILKSEKYHRTKKGPHHATCPHVSVAVPNHGPAVITRDDRHDAKDSRLSAPPDFRKELTELLNRHSKENGSDTPDYILAQYLMYSLETFDEATRQRVRWYSVKPAEAVEAMEATDANR